MMNPTFIYRGLECLVKANDALSVVHFLDGDAHGVFRKNLLNQLGPFDEAEVTGVEIVLGSHVVGFFQFLDAVEVKMIDGGIQNIGLVFVDNGESRRVDHVSYA